MSWYRFFHSLVIQPSESADEKIVCCDSWCHSEYRIIHCTVEHLNVFQAILCLMMLFWLYIIIKSQLVRWRWEKKWHKKILVKIRTFVHFSDFTCHIKLNSKISLFIAFNIYSLLFISVVPIYNFAFKKFFLLKIVSFYLIPNCIPWEFCLFDQSEDVLIREMFWIDTIDWN